MAKTKSLYLFYRLCRNRLFEINPSIRKIVIATNIAESSITVPDIAYVIDFCLTKEITYNA